MEQEKIEYHLVGELTSLYFLPWTLFTKRLTSTSKLEDVFVYGIYDNLGHNELIAYYGWISAEYRKRKLFPFTQEGYNVAKKWIEEGRIEYIKKLLI